MKSTRNGFIPILALIVIAVIVIGGGYYYFRQNSSEKGLHQNTQTQVNEALLKAKQASIKSFAASTMADLIAYYSDEKNTIPYDENLSIKADIQQKIAELNGEYPGDYEYNIFDEEKENVAIKVAEIKSAIYVCIDSKTVKVMDIDAQSFSNATDCSGGSLK